MRQGRSFLSYQGCEGPHKVNQTDIRIGQISKLVLLLSVSIFVLLPVVSTKTYRKDKPSTNKINFYIIFIWKVV